MIAQKKLTGFGSCVTPSNYGCPAARVTEAMFLSVLASTDPYCNEAMDTGVIPPLPPATELLQVHALIRHGSRTKCSTGSECWAGDADAVYECSAALLEGPDADAASGGVLFEKLYTRGKNQLRGNCALGQLVASGLQMQRANGLHLRAAYGAILPTNVSGNEHAFLLRSDDSPRTVASGQALFAAMYDGHAGGRTPVPWHTEDSEGENTIVCSSQVVCPAYGSAVAAATARSANSSHHAAVTVPLATRLSTALNRIVLPAEIPKLLDCLMSAQCPTVPSSGGDPPPSFTAALQQAAIDETTHQLFAVHNDSAVARFGAGVLIGEIAASMRAAVRGTPQTPRFVLLSGHDTGPMAPVLAALRIGGREFPRFGDLIAIELHRRHGQVEEGEAVGRGGDSKAVGQADSTMVRVVHNGEVVTRHIPGCPDTALCPFGAFYATAILLVPTPAECGRGDSPDWWPSLPPLG